MMIGILKPIFRSIFANPYVLLTLTALFWAGNAIVGRAAPSEISPAALTFGRWSIAACICLVIFGNYIKRDWQAIKPVIWIPLALGALGYATFNALLYYSLIYIPATNSAILQSAIPLLIFIFNFAIFRQKSGLLEILGFGLTLIGVAIIVTRGAPLSLFAQPIGIGEIIMMAAALVYALYTLLLRYKPEMDWRVFLTLAICGAACMSSIYLLIEQAAGGTTLPSSLPAWGFVAYTALLPSIVAQGFFIRGVELVGANRAGLFINLVPIFTALLAILLLGEQFKFYHAISLILVIVGVSLAQRK